MIPLTWQRDYPGGDRQTARLGTIQVGAVIVSSPKQAQWITWLPNHHGSSLSQWKYVRTEEQAKAAVINAVTTWLNEAGILSLAERNRADAAHLPLFSEVPHKDVALTTD